MTTHAIAGDVVVIEVGGRKRDCCVAIIAIIAADNVARVFTKRRGAVVTVNATAQDLKVIDCSNGSERNHGVAVLANRRRRNMVCWFAD